MVFHKSTWEPDHRSSPVFEWIHPVFEWIHGTVILLVHGGERRGRDGGTVALTVTAQGGPLLVDRPIYNLVPPRSFDTRVD